MSSVYARLHRIISSTPKSNNVKFKPITPKPTNNQPLFKTDHKSTKSHHPSLTFCIKNLLKQRNPEKLLQDFKSLSEQGAFRRQTKLYDITINRLLLANRLTFIEEALESQKKYIDREGFGARIIHLYGKVGLFDHAHQLFDEMSELKCEPGVKSLNALLGAAVNSKRFDKAYEIFRDVPEKFSIKLNAYCYSTAGYALCKLGLFDEAVLLLDEMEANGINPSVVFFNALMGAFYEEGDCVRGEEMWEKMVKKSLIPDMCSYGYKVLGLVIKGELSRAIDLVRELKTKGLKPNLLVYNSLLQGYCKNGDLIGARKCYVKLLKQGCLPNKRTFDILVPFLCDMEDYGFAFKVCEKKFKRLCVVDEACLQKVVDGLMKISMIDKAKRLVELGKSNSYSPYNLVLPSIVMESSPNETNSGNSP